MLLAADDNGVIDRRRLATNTRETMAYLCAGTPFIVKTRRAVVHFAQGWVRQDGEVDVDAMCRDIGGVRRAGTAHSCGRVLDLTLSYRACVAHRPQERVPINDQTLTGKHLLPTKMYFTLFVDTHWRSGSTSRYMHQVRAV